ncbi:hypothetical protein [Thermodesulforhabdus norvegica]|uniref:Uncharacterized protein n=1 Tax=Thermodesulforhabdus norvegica TaxID=39841 RepID=A0A1I4SK95_9BACT|nr:hypothetical protein [Thermodesulforhabdus norvegica]SFM64859.1 hypothetical protein SAMN05660836_01010 [Thermodesulforhabdus norvegica]
MEDNRDLISRIEEIEKQLRELSLTCYELQREIDRVLHFINEPAEPLPERHPVLRILTQRGHSVLSFGDMSEVILPQRPRQELYDRYYGLLKKYSFRLFLRDLLHRDHGEDWRNLSRYCSTRTARQYINFLSLAGLVEIEDNSFAFRYTGPKVRSFGSTLEWYIAEIFVREFYAPALFAVKLKNTKHGGDYDVVAGCHGKLVYVEVKSSPPRGVELPHVESFINRLEDLSPDLAFFLVDTELRMKDKIVKLFEEATGREPVRLVRELFYLDNGIYLINARKGITSNIRRCLQHYFYNRRFE